MDTEFYASSSNAHRGARRRYGAKAVVGRDFRIRKQADGKYVVLPPLRRKKKTAATPYLTPDEFVRLQEQINMNNPELGEWLGASTSSVVKWRSGQVPVREPVGKAMQFAVRLLELGEDIGHPAETE